MHIPAQSKLKSVRTLVASALLGLSTLGGISTAVAAEDEVVMYKDPNCGCCGAWNEHMKKGGFALETRADANMSALKDRYRVPADLRSCHTAVVGGYVFEGHVPSDLVARVLKEKPRIAGLAVPGMPPGSPGMESPTHQPYKVIAFDRDGRRQVYASR